MTAKQIVNRLLEDYDPDLAEISPEEVAAKSPEYPDNITVKTKYNLPDWVIPSVNEIIDCHLNSDSDSDAGQDSFYISDCGDGTPNVFYLEAITEFDDEDDDRNNVEEFYLYKDEETANEDDREGDKFQLETGAWALNYRM